MLSTARLDRHVRPLQPVFTLFIQFKRLPIELQRRICIFTLYPSVILDLPVQHIEANDVILLAFEMASPRSFHLMAGD